MPLNKIINVTFVVFSFMFSVHSANANSLIENFQTIADYAGIHDIPTSV